MAGRKSKYLVEPKTQDTLKIWNTGLYIRLSQEDVDNKENKKESNSITSQKALLEEYIKQQKDLKIYNTYIDDGYTGTDFNRPGFQALLEDIKNGKVTCVIVKDLSRLGRNYIEVGNYVEQIFPLFHVRFISINDNIDSFKDPSSINTIILPFKNIINDEYARDTSIKIKTALNSRKKKGEYIGAFACYGYIKSKQDSHKLVVDEEASEVVKKIFNWKVYEGLGNLSICHRLNSLGILNPTGYKIKKLNQNYQNSKIKDNEYYWCPSTVRNILKNDIYIGNVTQGKRRVKSYKIHKLEQVPEDEWVTVENKHTPIIDKETFEKAQTLRSVDTRVQDSGTLSIWAGILKCGDCKMAMHKKYCKNKQGKVYEYYVCGTYRKKSKQLCTKHTLKKEELEKVVLEVIKRKIASIQNIDKIIEKAEKLGVKTNTNENLEKIIVEKEKEKSKIENLKKGLYEDWKNEYITKNEYLSYKQKYEQDIKYINEVIQNLKCEKERSKISEENKWMEEFKKSKNFTSLDRDILTELIDYIEIYENRKMVIYFKFACQN